MNPEIKVKFVISGLKLSPEEISDIIGITPTDSWYAGKHRQMIINGVVRNLSPKNKRNGWCLEAKPDLENIDICKPLKELLQILSPKADLIKTMCQDYDLECEFDYVIFIKDQTPIMTITPDLLSELLNLKATLDFDLMLLSDD
jgi:hypothetical protein